MTSYGSGVSQAFHDIAVVLETLETTDYELTTATPVEDELLDADSVSVEVGVRIPFIEDSLDETTSKSRLTPTDVYLQDDGSLHIDLQATVIQDTDTPQKPADAATAEETEERDTTSKPNATRAPVTDDKKRSDDPTTATSTPAAEAVEQSTDDHQETSASKDPRDDAAPATCASDDTAEDPETNLEDASVPAYQDPVQLRAVYDEYGTFAEMTEALDVAVTPQTVRRYMIQHDIHQPASNTGSRPAETLLEADPDTVLQNGDTAATDTTGKLEAIASGSQAHHQSTAQHAEDEDPPTDETGGETQPEQTQRDAPATDGDSARDPPGEGTHPDEESTGTATSEAGADDESAVREAPNGAGGDVESIDDQAVAEAVNLPSHLTLTDVKEVVQTAKTLYEAEQGLEVSRERTRDLLQELNLLDFVHGRLATREEPSMAEIERRIRTKYMGHDDQAVNRLEA